MKIAFGFNFDKDFLFFIIMLARKIKCYCYLMKIALKPDLMIPHNVIKLIRFSKSFK